MRKIIILIFIVFSFFITSCTIIDDTNKNQENNQDENGEVEETPGEGETDNNSGSTGWLPWV